MEKIHQSKGVTRSSSIDPSTTAIDVQVVSLQAGPAASFLGIQTFFAIYLELLSDIVIVMIHPETLISRTDGRSHIQKRHECFRAILLKLYSQISAHTTTLKTPSFLSLLG